GRVAVRRAVFARVIGNIRPVIEEHSGNLFAEKHGVVRGSVVFLDVVVKLVCASPADRESGNGRRTRSHDYSLSPGWYRRRIRRTAASLHSKSCSSSMVCDTAAGCCDSSSHLRQPCPSRSRLRCSSLLRDTG